MKSKKAISLAVAILVVASFVWLTTRGNVVWRIHHHYPMATIRSDPANSPEPSWWDLIRFFGCSFYSGGEEISVDVSDETVDFNQFRGMTINHMHLTRCRVSDLRPLLSRAHAHVTFEACDLSAIPPDQMRSINPTKGHPNIFTLGNSAEARPGVTALHDYSLFP